MAPAQWVEVTARVAPADVDMVAALLGELSAGGVAIEPAIHVLDGADFAYELLDAPSAVRACFPAPLSAPERRTLRRRLAALPLSAPLPRLRYAEVLERDWAEEWKRFFRVTHAGERLVVCPSWERYEPAAGELVIELDPGRAFGTGQHPSTLLSLRALERHVRRGDAVIDVGTGSGILAIAAARLGARSVLALDTDGEAVAVARENVASNGVQDVVRVAEGSLGRAWPGPGLAESSADVVVVNISSRAVASLAGAAARALRPGGRLAAGGFIAANAGEVEAAIAAAGLRRLSVDAQDEWCSIVALAPDATA